MVRLVVLAILLITVDYRACLLYMLSELIFLSDFTFLLVFIFIYTTMVKSVAFARFHRAPHVSSARKEICLVTWNWNCAWSLSPLRIHARVAFSASLAKRPHVRASVVRPWLFLFSSCAYVCAYANSGHSMHAPVVFVHLALA
jgi:hypothetical protein